MQVKGTVVSVEIDVQIAKHGGGSYKGSRLTYRDDAGAIKEKAFHENVFKFNKELKVQLQALSVGKVFVMDMVKEGEFWNVKSLLPTDSVQESAPATTNKQSASSPYQSPKSTYETPEERAKKQLYIVRQSAINQAIQYALNPNSAMGESKITVHDILKTAKEFESYVFGAEFDVGGIETISGDETEVY